MHSVCISIWGGIHSTPYTYTSTHMPTDFIDLCSSAVWMCTTGWRWIRLLLGLLLVGRVALVGINRLFYLKLHHSNTGDPTLCSGSAQHKNHSIKFLSRCVALKRKDLLWARGSRKASADIKTDVFKDHISIIYSCITPYSEVLITHVCSLNIHQKHSFSGQIFY